jgi:hypothetical protein
MDCEDYPPTLRRQIKATQTLIAKYPLLAVASQPGNDVRGVLEIYSGADKSLARPGRKQATATEDFDVHISYL